MQKAKRQNYHARKDDLPVRTAAPSAAAHKGVVMSTQRIHGIDNSIMFAERGPGYHTKPHRHECEQINYIVEGEMWFFVEGEGYHCKKGDLMRIPPIECIGPSTAPTSTPRLSRRIARR